MKSNFHPEAIINKDQRKVVLGEDIQKQPFCMVGQVLSKFQSEYKHHGQRSLNGTGCLIAQNYVLTAAHNVYQDSMGKDKKPIRCVFKLQLCEKQCIMYEAIDYLIPEPYIKLDGQTMELHAERRKYDFALIKVKPIEEVKENLEFIPMVYYEKLPKNSEIWAYGYPQDLNEEWSGMIDGRVSVKYMFGEVGELSKEMDGMLEYQITTSTGQSGCPIFLKTKEGKFEIIGVHRGGGLNVNGKPAYNEAVSTSKLFHYINTYWKIEAKIISKEEKKEEKVPPRIQNFEQKKKIIQNKKEPKKIEKIKELIYIPAIQKPILIKKLEVKSLNEVNKFIFNVDKKHPAIWRFLIKQNRVLRLENGHAKFISQKSIPTQGKHDFQIKLISTIDRLIAYGIVEESSRYSQTWSRGKEEIYYNGHPSSIGSNGATFDVARQLQAGEVLNILVDNNQHMVYFTIQGQKIGECEIIQELWGRNMHAFVAFNSQYRDEWVELMN